MKRTNYGICLGLLALAWGIAAAPAIAEEKSAQTKISIGKKGLIVESADGQFKFKFGGRVHADASVHVGDTPANTPAGTPGFLNGVNRQPTDGVELRRARFLAKATLYQHWKWIGEVDFADNEVAIKDFDLKYDTNEGFLIGVGHQKQPYSLAVEMSSNDLPFSERGVDTDLVVAVLDRAVGVRAEMYGKKWYVAGGFYGDTVPPRKDNAPEGWGAAGKMVYTPIRRDDAVIHLGVRAAVRKPQSKNQSIGFKDETTHMSDFHIVNTGSIQNVDEIVLYGPEAAIAFGPVSLFGEYNRAILTRTGGDTLRFSSGHIGATVSLTGESRAASYTIKTGEFKRLRSKRRFGAVELAARYAYIDLSSGGWSNGGRVDGGTEQAFTTALNWYPNDAVRFVLNWTHIIDTNIAAGGVASAKQIPFNQEGKGLNSFTLRVQFNF